VHFVPLYLQLTSFALRASLTLFSSIQSASCARVLLVFQLVHRSRRWPVNHCYRLSAGADPTKCYFVPPTWFLTTSAYPRTTRSRCFEFFQADRADQKSARGVTWIVYNRFDSSISREYNRVYWRYYLLYSFASRSIVYATEATGIIHQRRTRTATHDPLKVRRINTRKISISLLGIYHL